jgi:hypothetical protein
VISFDRHCRSSRLAIFIYFRYALGDLSHLEPIQFQQSISRSGKIETHILADTKLPMLTKIKKIIAFINLSCKSIAYALEQRNKAKQFSEEGTTES